MTRHLELGRHAEERAEAHIRSLGWKVLGRNLVNPYGELDIVAMDGGELVVVEVRCRTSEVGPADVFGKRPQDRTDENLKQFE